MGSDSSDQRHREDLLYQDLWPTTQNQTASQTLSEWPAHKSIERKTESKRPAVSVSAAITQRNSDRRTVGERWDRDLHNDSDTINSVMDSHCIINIPSVSYVRTIVVTGRVLDRAFLLLMTVTPPRSDCLRWPSTEALHEASCHV